MWFFHRLGSDFWPMDKATVAPNLLASAICFVGGWLLKGRKIMGHLDELHRHHKIGKYRKEKP